MSLNRTETIVKNLLSLEPDTAVFKQLSDDDWAAVIKLADGHHLLPTIYPKLKTLPISPPTAIFETIKRHYLQNSGQNLALYAAFRQLSTQLAQENIPLIPLKGIYFADTIYNTLGERTIGDLDLLVPIEHAPRAFEIGTASGFLPTKPVIMDAWLAEKHQLCPQHNKSANIILEWHWHILPPTDQNRAVAQQLWTRARAVTVSNQPVYALAHEDIILHLANHLTYHHDFLFGLRSLIDLARYCHKFTADIRWDTVVKRSEAWGIRRGVFMALTLAQHHLAAPIPASAIKLMRPVSFDPQLQALAIQQLLTEPVNLHKVISLTRLNVVGVSGFGNKMGALWQALFPTPAKMAVRYGIEPGEKSAVSLYAYRWGSLARQAWARFRRDDEMETAVSDILKRKRQLAAWLHTPD